MTSSLPINLHDLLLQRTIEGERVEYKAGWNPQGVLHTICAFANDFHNLSGGYVVLGVEEREGQPSLPPRGIDAGRIDAVQNELLRLGQSAMRENGSPPPIFECDDDRTWFLVRLPVHDAARSARTAQGTEQDAEQDTGHVTEHETEHDTPQVADHAGRLVTALTGEMGRSELQAALRLTHRPHFIASYLRPTLKAGLIEMTLPDKPTSRHQRYRRTAAGEAPARHAKAKDSAE